MNTEKLDPDTQFLAIWRDKEDRPHVKLMPLSAEAYSRHGIAPEGSMFALAGLRHRSTYQSDIELLMDLGYPESIFDGLPPEPDEDELDAGETHAEAMDQERTDAVADLIDELSRAWEFVQRLWDADARRDNQASTILLVPESGTEEVGWFWQECEQVKRQHRLDVNPALEVDLGDRVALVEAWISDPDEHTDQTHITIMSQANTTLGVDALPVEDFDWDEFRADGTFKLDGQEWFTLDVGSIADDVLRKQGWVRVDGWEPASYNEPGTYETQNAVAVKVAK